MAMLRSIVYGLKSLFQRRESGRELDREVSSFLEISVGEKMQAGMSRAEAMRAARLEIGSADVVKEDVRAWGWESVIDGVLNDLRFAIRTLGKNPTFTAVAVLSLALGIGANTAIFSLVDAVMLKSLPVENPSRLTLLEWTAHHSPNVHGYWSSGGCANNFGFGANPSSNPSGCSFSEPLFRRLANTSAFSGVAAYGDAGQLNFSGNGPAAVISGQFVSGDFFRTMGIKSSLGRVITVSDDSPSAAPVVVLNYGYWKSTFGGSPDAVGRVIILNSVPFTIVGVVEPRFSGISPGSDYDAWIPLSKGEGVSASSGPIGWNKRQTDAAFWWLTVVGRLKPGVNPSQTQAEVSGIFQNEMLHGAIPLFGNGDVAGGSNPGGGWGASWGGTNQSEGVRKVEKPRAETDDPEIRLVSVQTGLTGLRGRYSGPLYILMLAVGIILLIACSNVAGLLVTRTAKRSKEIALRLTLGASRLRLARQMLTESLVLSTAGGILGIAVAYGGAQAIVSFVSRSQTRPLGFVAGVDVRVLGFTITISLLTGILFGIAPAFRAIRVDLAPALKDGKGSSTKPEHSQRKWLNTANGLIVAQAALAVVVLIGAGLLVRTLASLRRVDVGFDSRNVAIFSIDPTQAGYKTTQVEDVYGELQSRLSQIPGVEAVSYSATPPLSGGVPAMALRWPGSSHDQESIVDMLPVGPRFFETLRIPFLTGRDFSAPDFESSAANNRTEPTNSPTPVIVNQAFVSKFVGKENPLGQRFGEEAADANGPATPGFEIVGVVSDVKYGDLRRGVHPTIYGPQSHGGAWFEVRMAVGPQAILPAIRSAVMKVNANLPLFDVRTQSEQINRLLFKERLAARLSGFFAALALLLPCVGLYGLLSFEVSRRTREIGIRKAMGAENTAVFRLVVGRGVFLTIVGTVIGVCSAIGLTRFMAGMLYEVGPSDPVTFIAITLLFLFVGMLACYIPARRAVRVDPAIALRYE